MALASASLSRLLSSIAPSGAITATRRFLLKGSGNGTGGKDRAPRECTPESEFGVLEAITAVNGAELFFIKDFHKGIRLLECLHCNPSFQFPAHLAL